MQSQCEHIGRACKDGSSRRVMVIRSASQAACRPVVCGIVQFFFILAAADAALDLIVEHLEIPAPFWFKQADHAQQQFDSIPKDTSDEQVAFIKEYVSGVYEFLYPTGVFVIVKDMTGVIH